MKVRKTYKIRLYPTKEQEEKLFNILGASRFVYNYFLAAKIGFYKETGKTLSWKEASRDLTRMRNVMWLQDVHLEPLSQSLLRLEKTYKDFFRRKYGFPRFKSRKDSTQSFQKSRDWKIRDGKLQLQKDLLLKYRGFIDEEGELGTIVVIKRAGKWYATITAEIEQKPQKHLSKPIGLDVGLKYLVSASSGDTFENIRPAVSNHTKIARAQRVLSRRQKGSNRYAKARLELARVHERVSNIRQNHLHQVSHAITSKNHAVIAVEDLNVKGMVKNRSLARAIHDAGWSELIRYITYKQEWRGGELIKVGRYFPSSKLCSACGFLAETMPLSVRSWKCGGCGRVHDRDINAAKNILAEALASRVRGANVRLSKRLATKRG